MDTHKIKIACAGSIPYYSLDTYLSPTLWETIKNNCWDYRNINVNNPIGKSPYYFLKGLHELKHRYPESYENIEVHFWGNVWDGIKIWIEKFELNNIVIDGFLPKSESLEKLDACDMVLLTLATGNSTYKPFSIPGKVFDYFKLEKPILALAEKGSCYDAIKNSNLGILIDPFNSLEFAETLNRYVSDWDELKTEFKIDREYVEDNFSHENNTRRLAEIFTELSFKE